VRAYLAIMSSIAELEKKLNDAILAGKALEAFDELYDEDIVMQENTEPEYRGKAFNRKREIDFFQSVEAWHSAEVTASANPEASAMTILSSSASRNPNGANSSPP